MPARILRSPLARFAAGFLVSGAFLAITLANVDLQELSRAAADLSAPIVGIGVVLSGIEVGVRAERWRRLLRPLADASFQAAYGMLAIGHLANAVLPARLGDVTRTFHAGSRLGVSRVSVFATVAVERVLDATLLLLVGLAGVLVGFGVFGGSVRWLVAAGLVAVVVLILALVIIRHPTVAASRAGSAIHALAARFAKGLPTLRGPWAMVWVFGLTVASFAMATAIFMVSAAAVGITIAPWQAALTIAGVTLSTAIPAGPASMGTYEFVGMSILTSMGYAAEQSLLAVAAAHAVVVFTPASVGLVALWKFGGNPTASVRDPNRAVNP